MVETTKLVIKLTYKQNDKQDNQIFTKDAEVGKQ